MSKRELCELLHNLASGAGEQSADPREREVTAAQDLNEKCGPVGEAAGTNAKCDIPPTTLRTQMRVRLVGLRSSPVLNGASGASQICHF